MQLIPEPVISTPFLIRFPIRNTKTFAWLVFRKESRARKVPGIVLVHGGGGTAFKEWVERWNNHGFAAISIAVEGQTDEKDSGAKEGHIPTGWRQHANSGLYRTGIYGDSDKPLKDGGCIMP